jgi:hypothetical protein
MDWKKLLGSVTDALDQELRLRNAYLLAEHRLLRQQVRRRLLLTDSAGQALAALGQQLGRKALAEMATVAQADTILAWNRKFRELPGARAVSGVGAGGPTGDRRGDGGPVCGRISDTQTP